MVVVPAVIPVAIPESPPIVATEGLPLLHTPPGVASDSATVIPPHTVELPVIAAGTGLTVSSIVAVQPAGSVYIIVAVPGDKACVNPVAEPMLATAGSLLDHVPPAVASDMVVTWPRHNAVVPVIATGDGLTVKASVATQPNGVVNIIVVVPAVRPVTAPEEEPMDKTPGTELLHVPATASDKVIPNPAQTVGEPLMGASGLTVTFTTW